MNKLQVAKLYAYSDEDVMELFQGGYEEAFTEIVHRYQDRLKNFIFRFTHNQLDSEDIAQETFFRVYRSRHSYERIARFSTWLYTIANNLVRSHYKKSSRMAMDSIFETDQHQQEYQIDIVDFDPTPEENLQVNMLIEYVREALQQVPEEFREIIVMRDVQNLTYEEIMAVTELPMGTVKSRINRGRVRLQAIIKKRTGEETFF
jgi:RNA polymerase sigma-70 factor (ECF subfamily)